MINTIVEILVINKMDYNLLSCNRLTLEMVVILHPKILQIS